MTCGCEVKEGGTWDVLQVGLVAFGGIELLFNEKRRCITESAIK